MNFDLSVQRSRYDLAVLVRDKIDAFCASEGQEFRSHMGASIIGDLCPRKIWMNFRWVKKPSHTGRMMRLFERGHLEEARFFRWLRGAGIEVQSHDINGEQFRVSSCDGHFGGSCDGIVKIPEFPGMQFLLELKTSKDGPEFKMLFESGVAKIKPVHFSQMCVYGKHLALTHALYMVINKNNDDIYTEIVELDWNRADQMEAKAQDLINNPLPPPKISNHPAYHVCKNCDMYPVCHLEAPVEKNCRSCKHSMPIPSPSWNCGHWGCVIPKEGIIEGCDSWESIL